MNMTKNNFSSPISSYVLSCEGRAIDISNLAAPKMILGSSTGGSLYPNIELTIKTTARLASSCDSLAVWSTMWRQHQHQKTATSRTTTTSICNEPEQHRHSFSCAQYNHSNSSAKPTAMTNRRRSDPRHEVSMRRESGLPQHERNVEPQEPPRAEQQPVRERGQGNRPSGSGGRRSSPYLRVDMSSSGYPLLEIGELKVPYIGSAHNTKAAIQTSEENSSSNAIMNAECYSCCGSLICMLGMEYVICSRCYTVSPVSYGTNRDDHDYEGLLGFKPHGVGIGFVTSTEEEEPLTTMTRDDRSGPRRSVAAGRNRSGAAAHAA